MILAAKDASLKDIRGLGKKAATELQTKKILDVLFFLSSSLDNLKLGAGNFINMFDAANYELSWMRPVEKKEGDDPRIQRNEKNVEKYCVYVEDESILASEEYKFQLASARAMTTCKILERTRGSDAHPEWMAAEAQKIADKHP